MPNVGETKNLAGGGQQVWDGTSWQDIQAPPPDLGNNPGALNNWAQSQIGGGSPSIGSYATTQPVDPYAPSSNYGYVSNPTGSGPNDVNGNPIQTAYNPQYYANDQTAQAIATQLGGTVVQGANPGFQGSPGSPFSAPQANLIQLPNGTTIDAGILAGYEQTYANNPQMLNALIQGEVTGQGTSPQQYTAAGAPAGNTQWSGPGYTPPPPTPPVNPPAIQTPLGGTPSTGTPARKPSASDLGTRGVLGPPGQGGPGGNPINPNLQPPYTGAPIGAGGVPGNQWGYTQGSPQPTFPPDYATNPAAQALYTQQMQAWLTAQGSSLTPNNNPPGPGTGQPGGTPGTTPPAGSPPSGNPPSGNPPAGNPPAGYPPTGANPPATPGTMPPFPGTFPGTGYSPNPPGPTGGSYPSFPTWGTQGGQGNVPYMAGDPGYMASSEANRAIDYGNLYQQNFGNAYGTAQSQSQAYQNQSDAAYNWLNQNPGYSAADANNILTGGTPGGLGASMTTPDQFASNFLTPQEQAGMAGNPNAVKQAYDPNSIYSTLTPGQGFAQGTFQTQLGAANAALASGAQQNAATLGSYGTNLRSIVNNPNLQMSDAEVAAMKSQAGQQIGLQYGAAQDQMQRQAEAAGNVNPLALAAGRDRLLRSQSIDEADAVTNAAIAAQQAQRQQATTVAGMQSGAESDIANAGLATDLSQTGLATGTAGQFGATGSTLGTNLAGQNLAAGQYAGNTAISQAQYVDQQAQARAAQIAQNRQATAQSNQAQGYQQGYYTNQANSARYQGIAQQTIQGQQAARNYWQGQGQYQGGQANQAATQQLSGAQTSLSGMGQGGQIAMGTEIGRRSTRPVSIGTGGITVGV